MGGADHLVVAPSVTVEHVAFTPALPSDRAQIGGELSWREEAPAALQQLLDRSTDVRCDSQAVILLLRRRRASLLGSNLFDPTALCSGLSPSNRLPNRFRPAMRSAPTPSPLGGDRRPA